MRKWWLRKDMRIRAKPTLSVRMLKWRGYDLSIYGAIYHMRWGVCVMGPGYIDVAQVEDTLTHEFLHHWLNRNIGESASLDLDEIDCYAERLVE